MFFPIHWAHSVFCLLFLSFDTYMDLNGHSSDICIVGAGPAGCAAALYLHYHGHGCILVDKTHFPRDKVCGDALSGKVMTILKRIHPEVLERFYQNVKKAPIWGIRFVAPNRRVFDIPFKSNYDKTHKHSPGFVCKRIEFNNFLVEEVRKYSGIDFREGLEISDFSQTENGFLLKDKKGKTEIRMKLLLVSNGAHSRFSRLHAGLEREEKHTAAGVKTYVKNISGFHEDGFIEMHFLDSVAPGYFWAFPLPDNEANAGLGLRSDYVRKRKLKLREELTAIMKCERSLGERFADAEILSKTKGYPLPLGSKMRKISGNNYMLLGDAAHLVDPLTGEGIGNGKYSGWIAAEQAIRCLQENRFDEKFLADYDKRIKRVLGTELRLSYSLQRLMSYKGIVNFLANRFHDSQVLRNALREMYTDLEYRKKLTSPAFWLRLLFNIK